MYKCKNCGNTEKFIGIVSEKGNAIIYQHDPPKNNKSNCSWIYHLSGNCWKYKIKVQQCACCKSTKIEKLNK